MRRSPLRHAWTAACAAALIAAPATASAQMVLSYSTTSSTPGELSGGEVLLLIMAGGGASVPMVYAGVIATSVDRPPKTHGEYIGFAIGGGALSILDSVYLPWVEYGGPAFAYTFVNGIFYSMAGVGIAGLARPSDLTVPWLGGSIGVTSAALYRGVLSLAGQADYRGAAAAQLTLGLLGAAGCAASAIGEAGTERAVAIGCGGVGLLAAIHGGVMLAKPDRIPKAHKTKRRSGAIVPVPWFDAHGGGAALAGTF